MKNKYLVIFLKNKDINFLKDVNISLRTLSIMGDIDNNEIIKSVTLSDKFELKFYNDFLYKFTASFIKDYLIKNDKNIQYIKYLSVEQCFRLSKLNNIFSEK